MRVLQVKDVNFIILENLPKLELSHRPLHLHDPKLLDPPPPRAAWPPLPCVPCCRAGWPLLRIQFLVTALSLHRARLSRTLGKSCPMGHASPRRHGRWSWKDLQLTLIWMTFRLPGSSTSCSNSSCGHCFQIVSPAYIASSPLLTKGGFENGIHRWYEPWQS